MSKYPLLPIRCRIVSETGLHEFEKSFSHGILYAIEPCLDLASSFLRLREGHSFAFVGEHSDDIDILLDLELDQVIETCLQVQLHDVQLG